MDFNDPRPGLAVCKDGEYGLLHYLLDADRGLWSVQWGEALTSGEFLSDLRPAGPVSDEEISELAFSLTEDGVQVSELAWEIRLLRARQPWQADKLTVRLIDEILATPWLLRR